MNYSKKFKPKSKIKVEEKPKSTETPTVVIRKKERREQIRKKEQKKKTPHCKDCIDAQLIKSDDGFKGKTVIFCYVWNCVVHGSQAKFCPKFMRR